MRVRGIVVVAVRASSQVEAFGPACSTVARNDNDAQGAPEAADTAMFKDGKLYKAAGSGDVAAIRRLVGQGANLESRHGWHPSGLTPLHHAALNGKVEAVRALLDAGALAMSTSNHGHTPLQIAAYTGNVEVVRVLLDAGALTEARDMDGDTPLHEAAKHGNVEVVRALLDAGALIDAKRNDGKTPLHHAARKDEVGAVRVLLDRGALPVMKDNRGQTAADMASNTVIKMMLQTAACQAPAQRPLPALQLQVPQAATFPATPCPAGPPMYQGGSISLGAELIHQVLPLNSRLVQAGLAAVGQVVQGVLMSNPVALLAACVMLVRAVNAEVEAVQYYKQRVGRVLVRCGALVPALQKLEHVLVPPQSTNLEVSFVQSMSNTLVMLTQVLMGLEQLLARLQGGSGGRLAQMMQALKQQCYQQELDMLEQELRDCLSQLVAIISICSFTKQVSEELHGKEELQVARWAEQNSEDRKQDLQQLEAQVLAVVGGVQALQQQLEQQALELDGQRVVLQDVLAWLQRMNASSAVIAGHLQHLHRKVDSIQDNVSTIKDQLEKLMLLGRKTQQWSPTEQLPQLAISASRINASAVREAMDDAASGAFGKVVKAELDRVSEVAVKVFNFKLRGDRDCKEAIREAVLLSMANHPQVVRCFGLVFDPESAEQKSIHGSLVMEWVGGGTLYKWLQHKDAEALGLRQRVQLTLQLAAGLQHLHSKKLVHGDLKPENVLLTELLPSQRVPQAKLCDFGLAKYTSPSMVPTYTPKKAYTPQYTSPERLDDFQRTPKDDVYAFGMLMYFIATASTPLVHVPPPQLHGALLRGVRPAIDAWAAEVTSADEAPEAVVQLYCQLAKDCWATDPQLRPDSSAVHMRLCELAEQLEKRIWRAL